MGRVHGEESVSERPCERARVRGVQEGGYCAEDGSYNNGPECDKQAVST